jgi:4-amino-4-deoxy-L-arabinose transferase-like glycosyltransferase
MSEARPAWRWTLWSLVLGLALLRLARLHADPPPYLDLSGGTFADEGPWLHNARNLLRFGTLRTDGWNPMLLSPLTHVLGLAAMSLFGVGLAEARTSAALVFLLLLAALALWPRDRREGAVAVVLLGANHVAGMFGRLVLVDNMVLLLSCATAALLCSALRRERPAYGRLALAGALAALALITKILVVFLVPAWYAAIGLDALRRHRTRRQLAGAAAAFSAALAGTYLAYVILVRLPNAADFEVYLSFYSNQQALTPWSVAKNIISQRLFAYFSWTPVLLVAFLWALYERLADLWRGREWPDPEEALGLVWFLGGVALLSALSYRPLRYYLVLLPPMAMLLGRWLCRMADGEAPRVPARTWPLRLILLGASGTALGLVVDGLAFDFSWSGIENGMGVSLPRLGLLAALAGAAALAPGLLGRMRSPSGAAALLGAYLIVEGAGTMSWILQPEYTIEESSKDLARRLPRDAVVTGQFAIQLTFDTPLRAVPVWGGYYNSDRPFERYGITHLLLWTFNQRKEIRNFEEHFPQAMARARVIHRYWIKRSDVLLYDLQTPGAGP